MDEYKISLFQYKRGKEKLNRFYARPEGTFLSERVAFLIEKFEPKNYSCLDDTAKAIDNIVLEENKFIRIRGMKCNRPSYHNMISDAFIINIDKKGLLNVQHKEHLSKGY